MIEFDEEDDDDDEEEGFLGNINKQQPIPEVIPKFRSTNTSLESEVVNSFGLKRFCLLPLIGDQNQVISPISLFSALTILYIGSNGESAVELRELLELKRFKISDEQMLRGIQIIYREFVYESQKMRPNYQLINLNKILVKKEANISDKFNVWIKRYFNLEVERIDFKKEGNLIDDRINDLIKKEFKDRTCSVFPKTSNIETQLVLISALYYKGHWLVEFPTDDTKESKFLNYGSTETMVQMMSVTNKSWRTAYNMEMDSNLVEIPIFGEELTFILVLPKKPKGIQKLRNVLNVENINQTISKLLNSKCDVFLPKFKIEFNYNFETDFRNKLKIYSNEAEMREMDTKGDIKANSILHKVVFEVDESGQKKVKEEESIKLGRNYLVLKADHPFVFIVKDMRSQAFLFVGQICSFPQS